MNFLAPAAFALAATIPIVVVFYLLKRKREVKLVSSTLLWERFLAETQVSAPFQKLRHNWLLVLQLVTLTLVIFALARPYFAGETGGGRLLVVILDGSASMQSLDVGPSRFAQARREALRLVDSLQESDQMVVLTAGAQTEVKQSPTSNKAALRRALENSAVSDTSTRLTEALKLAQSLVRDRPGAAIHLFSDGAAADLDAFDVQGLDVVYHRCGERANNMGIVNLDTRSHPEDPARRAVFVSVANASTNQSEALLELDFEGQVVESRVLTIGPRQTESAIFAVTQERDGVFTARLAGKDDLDVDNEAWIMSLLPQSANVLLVSGGNKFMERAFRAVPQVRLTVVNTLADEAPGFDLVALDDVEPLVWPKGNLLCVRVARTNWFDLGAVVQRPAIVDSRTTHHLLRFVNFDNVDVNETIAVKTPPWALSLVESSATPLVLAGELARQRIVWIGFDTLSSSWPLRVSFPIFIANAVDWLNPASARAAQFQLRAGEPIRLTLQTPATTGRMTSPDGATQPVAIDPATRTLVFGQTSRRGVYRFEAGGQNAVFCASLLDAVETDTAPRAELKLGRYARSRAAVSPPADLETWRWIAAAGLALLMFEWWYYHRRTA